MKMLCALLPRGVEGETDPLMSPGLTYPADLQDPQVLRTLCDLSVTEVPIVIYDTETSTQEPTAWALRLRDSTLA